MSPANANWVKTLKVKEYGDQGAKRNGESCPTISSVASGIAALVGHVPILLTRKPRWVTWKKTAEGVRLPINCTTGRLAKSNDPMTWSRFPAAIEAYATGRFEGISFALGDGIFGIDLDACIADDGEMSPWAEEIVKAFPTYAEISPSGTGIKIFGVGEYDGTGINYPIGEPRNGKRPAIELNGWGKFFATTGRIWSEQAEVLPCRVPLADLVRRIRRAEPPAMAPRQIERRTPMTERASRWLAKIPGTISGNGGCHNATFRIACRLIGRFGLSMDDAYALMSQWNGTCEPPWGLREIQHKLREAWKKYGGIQTP